MFCPLPDSDGVRIISGSTTWFWVAGTSGGPAGCAGRSADAGTTGVDEGRRVTLLDSMTAFRANAVPVSRWQEVQWQQWTIRGWVSRRYRIRPQAQPPSMGNRVFSAVFVAIFGAGRRKRMTDGGHEGSAEWI